MAVYDVTSRPFIENCRWIWPQPDQGDFVYTKSPFQHTGAVRSSYVIHPDWISEGIRPSTASSSLHRRPPRTWDDQERRERPSKTTHTEFYRARIKREMEEAAMVPLLHMDKHYQVQHNSPWYINNPAEVRDSNVLIKANRSPVHLTHLDPWNNARNVLYREVSLPPLIERFGLRSASMADLKEPEMSAEDKCRFRFRLRQYKTGCEW